MVKSARREYLVTIRKRYRKACKKDKKPILQESGSDPNSSCGEKNASLFESAYASIFSPRAVGFSPTLHF